MNINIYHLGLAIAFVGAWIFLACIFQYVNERKLREHRKHMTLEKFVLHFRDTGVPADLCAKVYSNLPRLQMIVRRFPVLPADNLADIYRVGGPYGSPLCEVLDELAPFCGLRDPTDEEVTEAIHNTSPAITVADLVLLLFELKRLQTRERTGPSRKSIQ